MPRLPARKTLLIGIGIAVIVIVVYFGAARYQVTHVVPQTFTDARAKAAQYGQEITDLSKQVRDNVNQVQALERAKKTADARKLLDEVQQKNTTIKSDALALSTQLTEMAGVVPQVSGQQAQSLAVDAIGLDLGLITHVVTYNNNVAELLGLLDNQLAGRVTNQSHIDALVTGINDEVDAVNAVNTQAVDKFKAFDDAIRAGK